MKAFKLLVLSLSIFIFWTESKAQVQVESTTDYNLLSMPEATQFTRTLEEVNQPQIFLLGRGLINILTHDLLNLACVGKSLDPTSSSPDCHWLRWVNFTSDKNAFWLGSPIEVESAKHHLEISPKDLKRTLKKIGNEYKSYGTEESIFSKFGLVFAGTAFFGLVGPAIIMSAIKDNWSKADGRAVNAWTLGTLGVSAIGTAICIHYSNKGIQQVGGSTKIETASIDKEGWNWTLHPKGMAPDRFERFKKFISTD